MPRKKTKQVEEEVNGFQRAVTRETLRTFGEAFMASLKQSRVTFGIQHKATIQSAVQNGIHAAMQLEFRDPFFDLIEESFVRPRTEEQWLKEAGEGANHG